MPASMVAAPSLPNVCFGSKAVIPRACGQSPTRQCLRYRPKADAAPDKSGRVRGHWPVRSSRRVSRVVHVGFAIVCGLISLPFHYVFWRSVFEWARDKPSITLTTFFVVAAMGLAAMVLNYLPFALSRAEASTRELRLPNPVMYAVSVLLIANAVFQFESRQMLWGLESLAVSIGVFLLARKRRRR